MVLYCIVTVKKRSCVMIYYTEVKKGRKSIYKKIIADESGNIKYERSVEIPLYKIKKDGKVFFLLYNDNMNILSLPTSYLNFDLSSSPLNTRLHSANALRLLYIFLALTNYDIVDLQQEQLTELIRFLQGLNSNPEAFKTKTTRSNNTVNAFLSIYRVFFKKKQIKFDALFDSKLTHNQLSSFNNLNTANRINYTNNLRTTDPNMHTVPKYISPEEFEKLYRLAVSHQDLRGMCLMRLMYCYGLRLGEALGLTLEDLNETHRDNILVPTVTLRNRISDKPYQNAKLLGHVEKQETYHSKEYTKAKSVIVIDYDLFNLIYDYISEAHTKIIEKHPERYEKGMADVVSWRDAPESNHYIFLSDLGTPLSGQTWGHYLKNYFKQVNIELDIGFRENNLSHRFRHGFAMLHAHYRKDPVPVLQLQMMLRHRSISSTMKYYNPTQEDEFKIKEDFAAELEEIIPSLKEGVDFFEK